ncbi:hypothetical protein EW145_g8324 [Phellinidium pouzarii]|uniref:Uncharacterized protein n=1 Tax=Phellinidium pouzarii TaxID=167371 RepID=A0A4S4K746_9AGAM|nr:hypothetical protein EW145_g8324 [Phellinidium pouzarii]
MSTSPVPVIEISLAPQEEPQPEPYSPFTPMNAAFSIPADDPYRPALLTPPAISWSLSSSHKTTPASQKGRGINDEDFQALLRASKERSSTLGTRKHDLRKEVALKAHKSRQVERRALFLSKIGAPPSPSAVSMPKTPPDSPAIFHYSLPSPGLMSPLALFEKLGLEDRTDESAVRKVWVEQVDFRLPKRFEAEPEFGSAASAPAAIPTITVTSTPALPEDRRRKGHARKPSLPSLEQITERYTSQTSAAPTALPTPARARAPLPAFLQTRRSSPSPPPEEAPAAMPAQTAEAPRPRLTSTGRIRLYLLSHSNGPSSRLRVLRRAARAIGHTSSRRRLSPH